MKVSEERITTSEMLSRHDKVILTQASIQHMMDLYVLLGRVMPTLNRMLFV